MSDRKIGQAWIVETYDPACPVPAVTSVCGPGARRTIIENGRTIEKYGPAYAPEDTLVGHLRFALRYEPVDTGVLATVFRQENVGDQIAQWVRSEPNGSYARRAWFLYEWLTGHVLAVPDAGVVTYAPALQPDLNFVSKGRNSQRHKVIDNMLGVPGFCPTVRRTETIETFAKANIGGRAKDIVDGCDPEVLARAVNYLYTKETKSSFAIEHETASGQRAERFVAALQATDSFDPTSKSQLVELQNKIVDPRYAAKDFRDFQNFVGETVGGHREKVHFICPRPQDISDLMSNWSAMTSRLRGGQTDTVVEAAISSFGFVFLHPFEDGNGRIHRFLIHHILTAEHFTPPGVLFPVSAAIVRDRRSYDLALESFSKAIQPFIDWKWTVEREIEVLNRTDHLYRYFDATPLVEFLYGKINETVEKDLKEELDFVSTYDAALAVLTERIDMPDRRASFFVTLCLQNGGKLSSRKRREFAELSDEEIDTLEKAIADAVADLEEKRPGGRSHPAATPGN